MDAHELLEAGLGTPPRAYGSKAAYRADIKRLATLVHQRGGDFYGVDEYAVSICRTTAGLDSMTVSPNARSRTIQSSSGSPARLSIMRSAGSRRM